MSIVLPAYIKATRYSWWSRAAQELNDRSPFESIDRHPRARESDLLAGVANFISTHERKERLLHRIHNYILYEAPQPTHTRYFHSLYSQGAPVYEPVIKLAAPSHLSDRWRARVVRRFFLYFFYIIDESRDEG